MPGTDHPPRTENRRSVEVFVELYSFDNATYEITNTIDVSSRGARVVSKNSWVPNQRLSVRLVRGDLYSRARVVYCLPFPDQSFAMGLELHLPTEGWRAICEPPRVPAIE